MAKRLWRIVRVVYYMLRKSISKRKFMIDLHMLVKRGRLAGKAIGNIMFPQNSYDCTDTTSNRKPITSYYYPSSFGIVKRRTAHYRQMCYHAEAVKKAFEILNSEGTEDGNNFDDGEFCVETPLSSFGKSPAMVRKLRITDSPFPVVEEEDGGAADEEAELFIQRFCAQLRQQHRIAE